MTDTAQRIAMAELEGWKVYEGTVTTPQGGEVGREFAMNTAHRGPCCVPNYPTDANAVMYLLSQTGWTAFNRNAGVEVFVETPEGSGKGRALTFARAATMALLKAHSRWQDSAAKRED